MRFEYLLPVFFVIWLLLTLARQSERGAAWLSPLDPLQLLPSSKFFAPTPATVDLTIAFRGSTATGAFEAWRPLSSASPRFWARWFWNPGRIEAKAQFDLIIWLSSELREASKQTSNPRLLEVSSLAYMTLLNHIANQPYRPNVTQVQFAILRSSVETDEATLVFSSSLHPIEVRPC
jgi:hypothetical protein